MRRRAPHQPLWELPVLLSAEFVIQRTFFRPEGRFPEKFLQKAKKTIDFTGSPRYNIFLHEEKHAVLYTITVRGGATMPNIKSAKKRVSLSRAANEKNKMAKSALKTTIKKFDAAVASGDKAQAGAAYTAAVAAVDKAVNKGILHKNNAARKKSSMTLQLNKLG